MDCPISPWIAENIAQQVKTLYITQTAPFVGVFQDYTECVRQCRELEVRMGQLDKEAAELRDENVELHAKMRRLEDYAAHDYASQAAQLGARVAELEREVGSLYKDKSRLLEDVMQGKNMLGETKQKVEELSAELEQAKEAIAAGEERASSLDAALAQEMAARVLAVTELQAAAKTREAAVAEAERLREDNSALARRLVELKEKEADRMNEMNKLHEELMFHAAQAKREAEDKAARAQFDQLVAAKAADEGRLQSENSSRSGSIPASSTSAKQEGKGFSLFSAFSALQSRRDSNEQDPKAQLDQVVAARAADIARVRLESSFRSGPLPTSTSVSKDFNISKSPVQTFPQVHKGGCTSLAVQPQGRNFASCGADRGVALWDVAVVDQVNGPSSMLSGMCGSVADVCFTGDGHHIIACGADKSLIMWDVVSGRARHTLTGHTAPVICASTSPIDPRLAVSASEDRTIKMWDLTKGFCSRSLPSSRIANALLTSRDGNTIVTGHLDGGLSLWDVRGCQAGRISKPNVEMKAGSAMIAGMSLMPSDILVVSVSRDNAIRVWDIRSPTSPLSSLKTDKFTLGTFGSSGRGRCHPEVSSSNRLAVGGSDGTVFVWDLNGPPGREPVDVIKGHKDAVVAVAWSQDTTILMTADKGGTVAFWTVM